MNKVSFAEFAERALKEEVSLALWQVRLVKALEKQPFIVPTVRRRNMQWEFNWMMQLMWMRAQWMKGIETEFLSPYFELRKVSPSNVIFDELRGSERL